MQRGEIYLIDFGNPRGREQAGIRPAIVIQNDIGNSASPCTIVCPLTSKLKKEIPTHFKITKKEGLQKDSIALCEQLQTIDKDKAIKKLGKINPETMKSLNEKLILSLGLK